MSDPRCQFCGGEVHRISECPGSAEQRLMDEGFAEFERLNRSFEFGSREWLKNQKADKPTVRRSEPQP